MVDFEPLAALPALSLAAVDIFWEREKQVRGEVKRFPKPFGMQPFSKNVLPFSSAINSKANYLELIFGLQKTHILVPQYLREQREKRKGQERVRYDVYTFP